MSGIDNSLVGQPGTKRPGGKPEEPNESKLAGSPPHEQSFAQGDAPSNDKAGDRPARSDADPRGDKSQYSNGAGSNAS